MPHTHTKFPTHFLNIRQELFGRVLKASIDEPRPSIPLEEAFSKLRAERSKPRKSPQNGKKALKKLDDPSWFTNNQYEPIES